MKRHRRSPPDVCRNCGVKCFGRTMPNGGKPGCYRCWAESWNRVHPTVPVPLKECRKKSMKKPIEDRIPKLPKWAQEHIRSLERERNVAVKAHRDHLDNQTKSGVGGVSEPLYSIGTWDMKLQAYTPQAGLTVPSQNVPWRTLLEVLRQLRRMGYSCHRYRDAKGNYDSDSYVLVERCR